MSTKEKLIDKISAIEDPELLLEIDCWITTLIEATVQDTYSKEETDTVYKGYKQLKTGDTLDQKEAKKLFIDWLQDKTGKQHESANDSYPKGFKDLYGSVKDESFTAPGR